MADVGLLREQVGIDSRTALGRFLKDEAVRKWADDLKS